MLSAFGMAFRTPDLRKKIFFTLSIMALFRFGSVVPTPGVSYTNVQECLKTVETGGLFGLINLFSGGALIQLSVFALGIMPYISASIIMQLLGMAVPAVQKMQNEGEYEISWNGKNFKGKPVNEGLYYATLWAGGKSKTIKLFKE